jgi:hypothetical protein
MILERRSRNLQKKKQNLGQNNLQAAYVGLDKINVPEIAAQLA